MTMRGTPKRLSEGDRVRNLVEQHLDSMVEFVEHQHGTRHDGPSADQRRIMKCAVVVQWQDPDGSEYITVAGDGDLGALGLKGILHDGLYALAHEGEPGFQRLKSS